MTNLKKHFRCKTEEQGEYLLLDNRVLVPVNVPLDAARRIAQEYRIDWEENPVEEVVTVEAPEPVEVMLETPRRGRPKKDADNGL